MKPSAIALSLLAGCNGLVQLNGKPLLTTGATSSGGTSAAAGPSAVGTGATPAAAPAGGQVARAESGAHCKGGKEFVLRQGVAVPTGKGYQPAMKVGDANGDGLPDIVASHSGKVAVALNTATGFAPAATSEWPWAALANDIVLGDFNGDGKLDIAGGGDGSNGRYTYMLGNGDGSFKKGVEFQYAGDNNTRMVVADFDRDGKADIAVTAYPGINVFVNPGDGTFTQGVPYKIEGEGLVAGDFTGDGRVDLATFDADKIHVLPGKAGGQFGTPSTIDIRGDKPRNYGLVAADFDGDGKLDFAALGESGYNSSINIVRSTGNGSFAPPVKFQVADQGEARALAAGDLNGDGRPDLAVSNRKTILVFMNDGHGKFGAPITLSAGWAKASNAMSGEIYIVPLDKSGLGSVVLAQDGWGDEPTKAMVFRGACD